MFVEDNKHRKMSMQKAKIINQKEYLKKYLSGDKEKKKKKKEKKHKKLSKVNVKIIDDDAYDANTVEVDEDLLLGGEDAPQIVGEYIEENPNEIRSKWRNIAVKDEPKTEPPESDETVQIKQEPVDEDVEPWGQNSSTIKIKKEKSPSRPIKIKLEKRSSSPEPRRRRDSDQTPPRRGQNTYQSPPRMRRDSDHNPPRRKQDANGSSHRKRRDSDQSPSRRRRKADESPNRRRRDSDKSPPRRKRDTNGSPHRKRRDSDQSPPRRGRKSDQIPSRRHGNAGDSDQSPPRRSCNADLSPPSRKRDQNPPRKRRDSDQSPPRKRRDSDQSPPRKRRDSDQSPPRKRRDSGQSPPRKRRDSDQSPPRKRRDSDQSPPRKRRDSDQSPPRKRRDSDQSPPRKRRDSDQSPPRRRQSVDQSPPRKRHDSVQSPPRRHRSPSRDHHTTRINKEERKSRWDKAEPSRSLSPPPTHKPKNQPEMRTLDGKKAGLQDAKSLKAETDERRREERRMFDQMSSEVSGRDAEVQMRSTGRRGRRAREAAAEDPEEQKRKEAHEQKKKELYDRWGKGLKQLEDQQVRHAEMVHEASKPVARYANDEDLDRHLREQEHADDPMLEYMREKRKKCAQQSNKPVMPVYEGSYPENRFGIRPGYRWDGVDRSNGYEKRWFDVQNERRAVQDDAYKYSVEDM